MERRYPGGIPEDRQKQAEYEMDTIISMGFPGYFLVVADFIMWAKKQGIAVGPGRGSAAGSIVAYALGITDLDPIPHGLIFERFLNPERISMPDVDIDFDERRRVEVIRYVTEKYGADKVAMIGTYGTIKAKNAIKDSARVLGYPYAMGDRITKAMPADVLGKGIPAVRHHRPQPPALQRGRRGPLDVRERAGREEGHRHRARCGGPGAADGRARRRRDHVQRDHHRARPGLGEAHRRRHHHPVGLPEL